ncbi:MAG: DegV family protein [Bacillota bacterium]
MPIKIFADSMCDVPREYMEKYNITVMPLTVHFGDESYRDGVDITMSQFYSKLEKSGNLPTTSQVSPLEFYNAFREELTKGNEIICINGSSALSGTYNSAIMAKNQLETDKIHVVDSQGITLGAGMLVIKAARLAKKGVEAAEIVKALEDSRGRMRHIFIVDTLKYLQKGGRISFTASVLGSILNVKPILTVTDGKLVMLDKARGIKKALSVVFDMIESKQWTLDNKIIGINHTAAAEQAEMLKEMIMSKYNISEVIIGEVGSVVATHAGPGAVAFYFEE